jgi:hypothetical protein
MRDSSKLRSQKSPQEADCEKFLSTIHAAAHRFNSEKRGSRDAADYLVKQFDLVGGTLLKTVKDHSSAVACGKALDRVVPKFLTWFRSWVAVAALPKSLKPAERAHAELRRRLLRRAEHWKAKAHANCLALAEESPKQRATRRQRVVNPVMKRIGISSDDDWAARAGSNIDRNTPRDYRKGKTQRLRRVTREALAQALGIAESELPH